ncbi:MAG: acyl-ACP--UDP-N-acetylglucosamine O-acyltransferase [Elusimicrobia bacterium]|nr:acyl-ACP--UDP-N-acetylglucosamine O-acyltransferase [Elusimicrobiota bacterium]
MSATLAQNHIHAAAVVHPSAQLDPSVVVGPYAIIGEDVVIGPGTKVGAHAVVEHATVGKNNTLHPGCYVGTAPQDLKYAGEKTRLIMGDNNTVRECVTINRGTTHTGETRIGSNCLFMAYSHVAHDCRIGNGVIVVNSVALAGHIEVGDHAVLGGICAIHQFARIGRLAMLGGGSMNGQDVLPFCNTQGDRAQLRGLNILGMRRAGISRDAMSAVKDAYKTLFMQSLTMADAVAKLKAGNPCPEVQEWIRFIEAPSKRGLMRAAADGSVEGDA